ncbi:MAG: hypothetical protein WCK32_03560 [Chlorobiaceae bacterium]
MTEQNVRQSIRCWQCKEVFTLLIDTAGNPQLSLTCPYCDAPISLNLAQYPTTVTTVVRNGGNAQPKDITVFLLPDMIESQEPTNL